MAVGLHAKDETRLHSLFLKFLLLSTDYLNRNFISTFDLESLASGVHQEESFLPGALHDGTFQNVLSVLHRILKFQFPGLNGPF